MEKEKVSPPSCNTGAQNTSGQALTSCLDWLSVTFKNVHSVMEICELLGISISNFKEGKTGGKGYLRSMRFGGITIFYEGRENMGIHLEISGQGCRHFEKYSTYDWLTFMSIILLLDINVTRLDLAIDDFKGYFTINTLKEKIRRKATKSRFKDSVEIKKTKLSTAETKGQTLYFGSPQSMIQIRFYDKLLEQLSSGKTVSENITFWQRTEIQLRDDRAMAAVVLFVTSVNETGKLAAGILKNYLNFLVPDKDKNKSRWKVCNWWTNFLGEVSKLTLTIKAPDTSIERSYDWLDRQVETTLAMMYEAFNQDMTIFYDLINKGLFKMEDKHKEIIQRFKHEHQNITYKDFLQKTKKDLNL